MMKASRQLWNTMSDRIRWLNGWIKMRDYDIGEKGELFLRYLYGTHCKIHHKEYGRKQVRNINDYFEGQKLSEEQLEEKVFAPVEDGAFKRAIKNKEIVSSLGITVYEEKELRIGENMKKRQAGKENSENRKKRNQEILSYYCKYRPTLKELAEKYSLSTKQISTILEPFRQWEKPRRNDTIKELHVQWKLPISEIARWVGCSRDVVYKVLGLGKYKNQEGVEKENSSLESVTKKIEKCKKTFVIDGMEVVFSEYSEKVSNASCDEVEMALQILRTSNRNLLILGDSGTGKTSLVQKYLLELSSEQRKRILILSATGISASRLDGMTIHKAFGLDRTVISDTEPLDAKNVLKNVDLLIIEEISQVRVDLFEHIARSCEFIHQTEGREIFIWAIGDLAQLQPVAKIEDRFFLNEYYPDAHGVCAYDSKYWERLRFERIDLRYVHRQDNPELVEKLRELRYGKLSAIDWFNENCSSEENEDVIYLCTTNKLVDYYTHRAIKRYKESDLTTFKAKYEGDISELDAPAPKELHLAVGMPIMTICNTSDFKNGNLGTITKINEKSIRVELDNGKMITIRAKTFELDEGRFYTQLPVVLGYALTINKAQGLSLNEANIDVGENGCFLPFQLYVALSRVRTVENIHLIRPLREKDVIVDKRALEIMSAS